MCPRISQKPFVAGFQKKPFPTSAGLGAKSHEPGRNDFRFVQHQTVAGSQNFGQIAYMPMIQRVTLAIDHQQPGIDPRDRRLLRNQVLRKIIIISIEFTHLRYQKPPFKGRFTVSVPKISDCTLPFDSKRV